MGEPPKSNKDPIAYYSNYGRCVDIFAPGSDIVSAGSDSDTQQVTLSGTSMACPAVAGASALVIATYKDITPAEVREMLKDQSNKNTLLGNQPKQMVGSPKEILYIGL